MPLSEHEQRLLDQIERALTAEDPKFASTVRSTDLRSHHMRKLRSAAVLLVLGLLILLGGAISQLAPLGVLGFVVMLVAGMRAASVGRSLTGRAPATTTPGRKKKSPSLGGIAARAEERMRRRLDGNR